MLCENDERLGFVDTAANVVWLLLMEIHTCIPGITGFGLLIDGETTLGTSATNPP